MAQVIKRRYFDDGRPPVSWYEEEEPDTAALSTSPTRTVSHDEQVSTGMVETRNLVRALPEVTSVAKRGPAVPLPVQDTNHTIDVPMQATQHIEMQTSAVDRSKGFLIANVPLFAAFAMGVWLLSGWLAAYPLLSYLGLLIFWLSFVLAWLVSYWYTLRVSAEGIAMYEAKSKWGIIRDEHDRRWAHYDSLREGDK